MPGITRVGSGGAGTGFTFKPVTLTAVSGTITPNAALGYGPHTYIAAADVTLAAPTGGSDGQPLEVRVRASGATRVLTTAGGTTSIPAGGWWVGQLRYINPAAAPDDLWALIYEATVVASSGLPGGSAPFGTAPFGTSPFGG